MPQPHNHRRLIRALTGSPVIPSIGRGIIEHIPLGRLADHLNPADVKPLIVSRLNIVDATRKHGEAIGITGAVAGDTRSREPESPASEPTVTELVRGIIGNAQAEKRLRQWLMQQPDDTV